MWNIVGCVESIVLSVIIMIGNILENNMDKKIQMEFYFRCCIFLYSLNDNHKT